MKAKKHLNLRIPLWWPSSPGWRRLARALTPHPGTLIVVLVVLAAILWAQSVGALPLRAPAAAGTSTGTIAYQGRLADADGAPITDTVNMEFRLYDVAAGGIFLWEELWTGSNSVQVSDGLFNVMLGRLNPIPQSVTTEHDSLFLGITVGTDDEMTPRVQLGSVPFAVQALTVPDGSVTTEKIADEAVTQAKLGGDVNLVPPDESITTEKLADDAVTSSKIAHQFGASGKQLLNFVPRTGATGWDYSATEGNDQWHDLDLSSVVGDSAVTVKLKVAVSGATWGFAGIRKNGDTEEHEEFWVRALEGGDSNDKHTWHWQMIDVACDENQIIEYRYHWGGFTGPKFRLLVVGWWEPAHQ